MCPICLCQGQGVLVRDWDYRCVTIAQYDWPLQEDTPPEKGRRSPRLSAAGFRCFCGKSSKHTGPTPTKSHLQWRGGGLLVTKVNRGALVIMGHFLYLSPSDILV